MVEQIRCLQMYWLNRWTVAAGYTYTLTTFCIPCIQMVEQIHCLQCTCWTNNCSSWLDICTDHLLYSMYPAGWTYALTIFCIPCIQLVKRTHWPSSVFHACSWANPCPALARASTTTTHTDGCASLAAVSLASHFVLCCVCALQITTQVAALPLLRWL
jgi:hypothetical protein